MHRKLSNATFVRQWNSETAGFSHVYGVFFKEYLHVSNFLSFRDKAYSNWKLTFMNKMADFVPHDSYHSFSPM